MNEQTFQPGELVDITIRRVRVSNVYPRTHRDETGALIKSGAILVVYYAEGDDDARTMAVRLDLPSVTVERVAPADWPPRYGDLWRDRDGQLWTVNLYHVGENYRPEYRFECVDRDRSRHYHGTDQALAGYGPMTLVHREHPDPDDDGDGE